MNQARQRAPAGHRARRTALAAAVLGATIVAGACQRGDPAKAAAAQGPQAMQIGKENIAIIGMGQLQTGPALSGTLTPQNTASVRAEVAGPVLQTYVEQGQSVARGTLLARLDDAALRESALSAQSALRSAQLTLDNATRDLERSTRLAQAGAIADRDLETAKRGQLSAEAALADAKARATLAERQLEKTQIRAPIAGIVSERQVNAGDAVQPGSALFTIVDPTSMRLEASVPSEQVQALRVGQTVQFNVNGYPGRSFTGRIDRINPAADPATRQVRLYVTIPNAGRSLVSGLFAEGRVATESKQALAVPLSAVDMRGLNPTVMRIHQGRAEQVPVALGLRDEQAEKVEVTSGLAAGDTLLVGTAQGIVAGTPVKVTIADDRTTAQR